VAVELRDTRRAIGNGARDTAGESTDSSSDGGTFERAHLLQQYTSLFIRCLRQSVGRSVFKPYFDLVEHVVPRHGPGQKLGMSRFQKEWRLKLRSTSCQHQAKMEIKKTQNQAVSQEHDEREVRKSLRMLCHNYLHNINTGWTSFRV
jgi:hypothetical protein